MEHQFSKENQSSPDTAYRFSDFELHPRDQLLKRAVTAVPLQPKAFDALLCLLRKCGTSCQQARIDQHPRARAMA
jgi:DNA-binding response OmpR family regulator